ncbi:MAG: EamA family transporter [Chloroflexota bacterium]|nr:EamA family transporter [Chloroflexota bacterium]
MPRRHVFLAVAVAVVWGVNFVVIHVGLESFPPLLFAALRFTLIALPAVFFVKRPPIHLGWIAAVGVSLSGGQFGLLFVAMDQGMPAGLASVVLQLQAVFTIALAVLLLGERPRRAQLAGAGVALAGMVVIGAGRADAVPLLAILLCVGAAASWGVGNVCTRRAQAPDALGLIVWSSLVPPLPLAGLSLAIEGSPQVEIHAAALLALIYVVVLSTVFGFGVWTWLLKRHEASKVAPFSLLVPAVGIASAWVALGEQPTPAELAGAAIVLVGLALLTGALTRRPPRRRPRGHVDETITRVGVTTSALPPASRAASAAAAIETRWRQVLPATRSMMSAASGASYRPANLTFSVRESTRSDGGVRHGR